MFCGPAWKRRQHVTKMREKENQSFSGLEVGKKKMLQIRKHLSLENQNKGEIEGNSWRRNIMRHKKLCIFGCVVVWFWSEQKK